MNRQSQKAKTIFGLALVCMTALLVWRWMYPPDPTYDGRTVREWLEELVVLDGRTQDEEAVRTAIQAMGTNAIPGLLKWMAMPFEAPPLRYRIKLICIRHKLLYRLAPRRAYNPKDEEHFWSVMTAAEALRPRAKEIVPVLVRSYHSDMRCQRDVLRLLGLLKSAEAVPFLSSEVTNTGMYLRSSVYSALGTIKHEGSIPVLLEGLKDPELWVCRSVASALGNFGPSASNAVPALEAFLSRQERVTASDSQSELRLEAIDAAKGALQEISGVGAKYWTSKHITNLNQVHACSKAYRYVAIERMLGEANLFAGRAGLPERLPIREQDLVMAYASPPFLSGGTGALYTDKYSFEFGSNGRLRYVTCLNPFESQRFIEIQRDLAKMASNLTTNEAYELATNWIAALSIDVNALEKKHPVCMRHQFYYGDNNRQIELPIIDVLWGEPKKPAVEVSIYGPDRKLLKLRQNNESFSRRPTGMAKDPVKLLGIKDTDFSQFSNEQRSNLVSEFVIRPGK